MMVLRLKSTLKSTRGPQKQSMIEANSIEQKLELNLVVTPLYDII